MSRILKDVYYYLFNKPFSPREGETYRIRDELRARFVSTLASARDDGAPLIVCAHSLGTVIAYDCLKQVDGCERVDAFMTLGSPLAIDEVEDRLKPGWSRENGFPAERLSGSWVNIYDPLDIVARLDPRLANDYMWHSRQVVEDKRQNNPGLWTHGIVRYLPGKVVQETLSEMLRGQ